MDITVNYLHVLVAAIVNMGIGAFWYSPAGFGKAWVKLMGFTSDQIAKAKEGSMTRTYLMSFVGSFVMSYVLAHMITILQLVTFRQGAELGFWLWLGFIATVFLNSVLWEGKAWKLFAINVSHYLAVLAISGGILAAWS